MKGRKSKSWAMADCGMAAALSVALMLLGAVFPIAMFIAPAVASFLIATFARGGWKRRVPGSAQGSEREHAGSRRGHPASTGIDEGGARASAAL